MTHKHWQHWLLSVTLLLSSILLVMVPMNHVQASVQRVLLVYDAQNTSARGNQKIDILQRTLTALNLRVKTVAQTDYQAGMIKQGHYTGVITMVNWSAVGITNKTFIRDRDAYRGIKLHIGDGLTAKEASELGATKMVLYQQQMALKTAKTSKSLPFKQAITVLTHQSSDAVMYGRLVTPDGNVDYAYGTVNHHDAYLPFFNTSGIGLATSQQLLAHLFTKQTTNRPLLTIRKVTPYSNLTRLVSLSRYLRQQHIPFAISAVSVTDNSELAAYRTYTKALREVELNGGVVFLQTPQVGGASASDGTLLDRLMTGELVDLANQAVFPVGISSEGYWNQDAVLRKNALQKSSSWLLLANKTPTYLKQDNDAVVAQRAFAATPLKTVSAKMVSDFAVPTALTISLPTSKSQLRHVERTIVHAGFEWANLQTNGYRSTIRTGTTELVYHDGKYYLNGHQQRVTRKVASPYKTPKPVATQPLFKGFFKFQGQFLTVFFGVVLIALVVFIIIGRRIYWRRLRRK